MTHAVLVFGTQAELTKTVGLVAAVPPEIKLTVLWTGQHPDLVPEAAEDLRLNEMVRHRLSGAEQSELVGELARIDPDVVLVQGDTRSALLGAKAASEGGLRLVHLEAGLRLSAVSEPEEMIRREITRLADFHVATSAESAVNLATEGVSNAAIRTSVPLAAIYLGYLSERVGRPSAVGRSGDVVVTLHRASALDRQHVFGDLLLSLADLLDGVRMVVVRRPDERWRPLFDRLAQHPAIDAVEELLPTVFNALIVRARCVLTDSAGVQQECELLGVPLVVLRPESEIPGQSPHTAVLDAGMVMDLIEASAAGDRTAWQREVLEGWHDEAARVWEWVGQWVA